MIARKQYSKEFKLDAVSLVLEQGYTRAAAARSLEINISQLGRWIREYREDSDGQAFRGNGKLTPEQDEIRKLKVRVKQLEMEKRILEPVQSLFSKRLRHAKWMNCKLVLSLRSQFFHNLRFFSNQAKLRSTTQRLGLTLNLCNSLRLAICTVARSPRMSRTPLANGSPV